MTYRSKIAFPAMARAFNTTPSALAWVSNGYIAGLTLVIPFSSILTRRVGPKRVILLSLLLFSAASVAAGLAGKSDCLASRTGRRRGVTDPGWSGAELHAGLCRAAGRLARDVCFCRSHHPTARTVRLPS